MAHLVAATVEQSPRVDLDAADVRPLGTLCSTHVWHGMNSVLVVARLVRTSVPLLVALAWLVPSVTAAAVAERELQVLGLMAEGRTKAGIAGRLWLREKAVQAHVRSIRNKLDLPASSDDHRRVLAVLA